MLLDDRSHHVDAAAPGWSAIGARVEVEELHPTPAVLKSDGHRSMPHGWGARPALLGTGWVEMTTTSAGLPRSTMESSGSPGRPSRSTPRTTNAPEKFRMFEAFG